MNGGEIFALIVWHIGFVLIGYSFGSHRGFKKAHSSFVEMRKEWESVISGYKIVIKQYKRAIDDAMKEIEEIKNG